MDVLTDSSWPYEDPESDPRTIDRSLVELGQRQTAAKVMFDLERGADPLPWLRDSLAFRVETRL